MIAFFTLIDNSTYLLLFSWSLRYSSLMNLASMQIGLVLVTVFLLSAPLTLHKYIDLSVISLAFILLALFDVNVSLAKPKY